MKETRILNEGEVEKIIAEYVTEEKRVKITSVSFNVGESYSNPLDPGGEVSATVHYDGGFFSLNKQEIEQIIRKHFKAQDRMVEYINFQRSEGDRPWELATSYVEATLS